jgi:metal-sulfur cluster biosynthetic enzyme
METTTLTPEAILTSLTRAVHPEFGIHVVNLGTIDGIELDCSTVQITMNLASDSTASNVKMGRLIPKKSKRRLLGRLRVSP